MSAIEILEKAAQHMRDRAETYDKPDGERSIGATVAAFNAVTGDGLMNSGERGWLFMTLLKMVRSQQGEYKADNYEDGAAYVSLMGESACIERNGGLDDAAIKAAAFKTVCDNVDEFNEFKPCEYTLQEVIGDAVLSDWAEWVAVDKNGEVWEYGKKPMLTVEGWSNPKSSRYRHIGYVVPPISFKKCIWEIKK